MHWPDGIKAKGEVRDQYHHITDIGATILDVTKTPFLEVLDRLGLPTRVKDAAGDRPVTYG